MKPSFVLRFALALCLIPLHSCDASSAFFEKGAHSLSQKYLKASSQSLYKKHSGFSAVASKRYGYTKANKPKQLFPPK